MTLTVPHIALLHICSSKSRTLARTSRHRVKPYIIILC